MKPSLGNILLGTKLRGLDICVTQDKIFSRRISQKTKLLNCAASLRFFSAMRQHSEELCNERSREQHYKVLLWKN